MNVSRRWLEAFLQRPLDAQEIARRLVMLGAGVDAVEPLHPGLAEVVIGLVESVRPHPNADRLRLCDVNDGSGTLQHVVCGAPNVAAGKKYPFARVGTTLPGGLTLERRKIRGESSEGMLCSARELGLGQEHDGILELDTALAPGAALLAALPVDDDRLVLDVTPNRPDLLGHKGVARELAASLGVAFRLPEIPGAPSDIPGTLRRVDAPRAVIADVTVGTDDPEGCRRFTASVIRGVKIGPSPVWLADRVQAAGMRSINNVVDATNYVLLELNHPTHAYDLARLRGGVLIARRARSGETIVTLDGVSRTLQPDMTVIADAEGAVGIGGVMGAASAEVSDTTTDILLECAWFDPRRIRRTRRALGLSTDASYRFERGVDLWGLPEAQRRGIELILAVAGGRFETAVDVWPVASHPPRISLRLARVARVLGADVTLAAIEKYLVAIGCTVLHKPDDARLAVDVPGWRPDLLLEIDLIEEIARLQGYDTFPTELRPFRVGQAGEAPLDRAIALVRNGLAGLGLYEAQSLPLGPSQGDGSVKLVNPLSAEDAWLRQSLLPGLVRAVETNWSRQVREVRLFEIGTVFRTRGAGERPTESVRVAGVITGARAPAHWSDGARPADTDLWDLKGLFEAVIALANPTAALHVDGVRWRAKNVVEQEVGRAERLDVHPPAWAAPVFGFELELSAVPRNPHRFVPLAGTPSSWRDLNLVLGGGTTASAVLRVLQQSGGPLLESVEVASEFRADAIGVDRRAVQFRLTFRAPDRTIRDEEVEAAVARALKALEHQLDAKLRTS